MSPAEIRFTAKPSPKGSCKGCIFLKDAFKVCQAACEVAVQRGLPDCDDANGYIYVADETDPRQIDLLEVAP